MFFHPSLALFITQRDMINSLSVLITWIMCMFIVLCCLPLVTGIDHSAQLWDLCLSYLPGFSTYMIHTFCILKTRVLSIELFINELSPWMLLGVTGSRTDNESCWIFIRGYTVLWVHCIHIVFIREKCRPPQKMWIPQSASDASRDGNTGGFVQNGSIVYMTIFNIISMLDYDGNCSNFSWCTGLRSGCLLVQ